MTTSNRITGNHGIVLTMKKGATAAVSFADDAKGVKISGDDKDSGDLTFAEAAAGATQNPNVKLKFIQSTDSASLHQYLFDNQGATVDVVYGPHGNAAASPAQPHFKVTNVLISGIPEIGGDATTETQGFETEVELKSTGTVTKVTA